METFSEDSMSIARSAKQLGNIIQAQRLKVGLTQHQLADLAGTGQKTISKIENGILSTRIDTIFSILAALNLQTEINSRVNNADIMSQTIEDLL